MAESNELPAPWPEVFALMWEAWSAAISARVGSVLYAARDPYGGAVGKLVPSADHEAHPLGRVEGPLTGRPGLLSELLHVAHFLWRVPDGNVTTFYRRHDPELVAIAQTLPSPDADATLDDAFAALG